MVKTKYWAIVVCRSASFQEFYPTIPAYLNEFEFYDENLNRIYPSAITSPGRGTVQGLAAGIGYHDPSNNPLTLEQVLSRMSDGVSNTAASISIYEHSSAGYAPPFIGLIFSSEVTIGRIVTRDQYSSGTNAYNPYNLCLLNSPDGVDWSQFRMFAGRAASYTLVITFECFRAGYVPPIAYPHVLDNKGSQCVALQTTHGRYNGFASGYHRILFQGAGGAVANDPQCGSFTLGGDYSNNGQTATGSFYTWGLSLIFDEDWNDSSARRTATQTDIGAYPSNARIGLVQPTFIRGAYSSIYVGSNYNYSSRGYAYRWSNDGVTFHTSKIDYHIFGTSQYNGTTWDISSAKVGVEAAFKYFRVKVTHHGEDGLVQSIALGKIELASSVGGANLCSGGVSSSSSGVAADAFSGVGWSSGSEDHPWVQYAFPSAVAVREVRLFSPSVGVAPLGVQIEVSDNGRYWTTISYHHGYSFPGGVAALDLFTGYPHANQDYQYRYLKVQSKATQSDIMRYGYYSRTALQRLRFKDSEGNIVSPVKVLSRVNVMPETSEGTKWGSTRLKASSLFLDSGSEGDFGNISGFDQAYMDDRYKKWPESQGALRTTLNHSGPAWNLSDFSIGLADFTLEAWVCPTAGGHGGANSRIVQGGVWGVSGGWALVCVGSENPTRVGFYSSLSIASPLVVSVATLTNGVFTHVCVERVAGVFNLYINGVLNATNTPVEGPSCYFSASGKLTIGANSAGGENFYGYIDLVRLTVGRSRYKGGFPPPTSFLSDTDPYWGATKVALLFNGSNGATTTDDLKGNIWAFSGNAAISTSKSVDGSASLYLDGTGDYISHAGNKLFTLGVSDMTLEFWCLVDEDIDANEWRIQAFVSFDSNASTPAGSFALHRRWNGSSSNILSGLELGFNNGSSWIGSPLAVNAAYAQTHPSMNFSTHPQKWTHVVFQRRSGVFYMYFDGVLYATLTGYEAIQLGAALGSLALGGALRPMAALYSDFRVTNGVARYSTVANTLPSSPIAKSILPSDYADCVLHLSGMFLDASNQSYLYHIPETLGDTPWSSLVGSTVGGITPSVSGRHGAGSYRMMMGSFVANGISWSPQTVGDFAMLPTSLFTVEGYFSVPSSASGQSLYNLGNGSCLMHFGVSTTLSHRLGVLNNNLYLWLGATVVIGPVPYTVGANMHLALVGDGTGTVRLFKDGVYAGSGTLSASALNTLVGVWGNATLGTTLGIGGASTYVDGVRFTASVRYPGTTTFTPAGFPRLADDPQVANVKLLVRGVPDDLPFEYLTTAAAVVRCLKKTKLTSNVSLAAGGVFSAGSGVFDGSSSVISFTPSAIQKMPGDFTLEAWVNLNTLTSGASWPGDAANWQIVFSSGADNGTGVQFAIGVSQLIFTQGATTILSASHGISSLTWNHIAVQRSGDVFSLYINGVRVAQTTLPIDLSAVFGTTARIGSGASGSFFNGKMNDIRLTSAARWDGSSFSLATSHFLQDSRDVRWGSVVLALHLSNTAYHYDALGHELAGTSFPGAFRTVRHGRFVPMCMQFYSYATTTAGFVPQNFGDFNFGEGDFEIRGWLYGDSITALGGIVGNYNIAVEGTWCLGVSQGFLFFDCISPDRGGMVISATQISAAWTHFRVGRKGSYLYMFFGSNLVAAKYDYTAHLISNESNPVGLFNKSRVTVIPRQGDTDLTGAFICVEDLLVIKSASFTHPWLPTARFPENSTDDPYWSSVVLLTHMDQGSAYDSNFSVVAKDSSKYGRSAVSSGSHNAHYSHMDFLLDFGREVKFSEASALVPIPDSVDPVLLAPGSFHTWLYDNSDWSAFDQQTQVVTTNSYCSLSSAAEMPTLTPATSMSVIMRGVIRVPVSGTYQLRSYSSYGASSLSFAYLNSRGYTTVSQSVSGFSSYVSFYLSADEVYPWEIRGVSANLIHSIQMRMMLVDGTENHVPASWLSNIWYNYRAIPGNLPAMLTVSGVTTPEMKDQWSSVALGTFPIDKKTANRPGAELVTRLNIPRVASEAEQHRYWRVVFFNNQGHANYLDMHGVQFYERVDGPPLSEFSKVTMSSKNPDVDVRHFFSNTSPAGWSPVFNGNLGAFIQFDCITPVRAKYLTVSYWDNGYNTSQLTKLPQDFEVQYSDDGLEWVSCQRMKFPTGVSRLSYHEGVHYYPVLTGSPADAHVLNEYYAFTEDKANAVPLPMVGNEGGEAFQRNACIGMNTSQMPSNSVGPIYGTVSEAGNPVARRVVLLDYCSMTPLRSTWSKEDGSYRFEGVDLTQTYLVLSQDYHKIYNAVVQDSVTAEGV